MNQSAETPAPVLYPTQYGSRMPGALQTFREGSLGNRRRSAEYGQSLAPFDNGVFGPALGNAAETPQPLQAYRDGFFSQGVPSVMPGPLTAYRGGLFSSLGQAAAGGAALNFSDPNVIFEWTLMMQEYWGQVDPATAVTTTWDEGHSDRVLAFAQALSGSYAGVTFDLFAHAGGDGLYYPTPMLVIVGFGGAYNKECKPGGNCRFPRLRDYYAGCLPSFKEIQASGSASRDFAAAFAEVNATCPIAYPAAPRIRVAPRLTVQTIEPGTRITTAQPTATAPLVTATAPLVTATAPVPRLSRVSLNRETVARGETRLVPTVEPITTVGPPPTMEEPPFATEPTAMEPAPAPAAGPNKALIIGGVIVAALLLGGGAFYASRRK